MIPLACLLLLTALLRSRSGDRHAERSLADCLAIAVIGIGSLVVASTVVASLLTVLNTVSVGGFWLILAVVLALGLVRRGEGRLGDRQGGVTNPLELAFWPREAAGWVGLAVVLTLVGLTLTIATATVPRVYDALAYQMPRVFYWLQNQSAAFYPAHDVRQNYISPLPAYLVAHSELLHGWRNSALIVQWASYVGTIGIAALLVRDLAGSTRVDGSRDEREVPRESSGRTAVAWIAAALVACLPNLVLQASTALSDVVSTFWFLLAVWVIVRTTGERSVASGPWSEGALVGASVGLAILAKASTAVFLAPFGLWWLAGTLRRGLGAAARLALAAALLFLALNGYHLVQTTLAYGHPLSTAGHASYLNADRSPAALLGSVSEHVAVQSLLPVMRTPEMRFGDAWNRQLERGVRRFEGTLGVDPEINNLPEGARFDLSLDQANPPAANSPQSTGSALHFWLGSLASLAVLWSTRRRRGPLWAVALAAVFGFVLFAAIFRWQPWLPRFHLPYLVLATVVFAAHWAPRWPRLLVATLVVLLGGWAAFVTLHHQEQAWSDVVGVQKAELYVEATNTRQLAQRVSSFDSIGVLSPENVVEYSVLQALKEAAPEARIGPVFAELPWRDAARRSFDEPDAIVLITQYREPSSSSLRKLRQERYREVLANPLGRVFVKRRRG